MTFNKHSKLVEKKAHAFLGASNYHWVHYDDMKLGEVFSNYKAKQRGTELHEFASQAIKLGMKMKNSKLPIGAFINDAIGFAMESEVMLYYSDNFFGTADAISFRDGLLRIHDLKTGRTQASMYQLFIYAALFCLEYGVSPFEIQIELRIYQFNPIEIFTPDPQEIFELMEKAKHFDGLIEGFKLGE